jgi:hypothetical protein
MEFSWCDLVLYKPFFDFCRDIGTTTNDIIQNWEKIHHNRWHVDHNPIHPKDPSQYEYDNEDFLNVHRDSR